MASEWSRNSVSMGRANPSTTQATALISVVMNALEFKVIQKGGTRPERRRHESSQRRPPVMHFSHLLPGRIIFPGQLRGITHGITTCITTGSQGGYSNTPANERNHSRGQGCAREACARRCAQLPRARAAAHACITRGAMHAGSRAGGRIHGVFLLGREERVFNLGTPGPSDRLVGHRFRGSDLASPIWALRHRDMLRVCMRARGGELRKFQVGQLATGNLAEWEPQRATSTPRRQGAST